MNTARHAEHSDNSDTGEGDPDPPRIASARAMRVAHQLRFGDQPPVGSRADWLILVLSSAIVAVVRIPLSTPVSWRYFDEAAALVFDARKLHGIHIGLRLYEVRPGDQFGPLSIVAAQALRVLGGSHVVMLAHLLFLAVGLGVLWLVIDAAQHSTAHRVLVSRVWELSRQSWPPDGAR
jgi:hypothetical protein